MEPLPIPCPARLIPDASNPDTYQALNEAARDQRAVFVAVEHQGRLWKVTADTLTAAAPHSVTPAAAAAIDAAVRRLISRGEIRSDSSPGPVYCVLYDLQAEERARELAAALHAALYGDTAPLTAAVTEDD